MVFDRLAERYDRWYEEEGKKLFEKEVCILRRAIGNFKKGVEIGVGSGRFAGALCIGLGVDPSLNMLRIAKSREIKVILGTGEAIPLKSNTFDLVLIAFTICFVKDPYRVIREARRILQKGGRLVIALIPSDSSLGRTYKKMGEEGHPIYREARFLSEKELREILTASHLKVEKRLTTSLTGQEREEDLLVYTCSKL